MSAGSGALRWTGTLLLALFAGFSAALFAPVLTYREVASPDGAFTAIAKSSLFYSLIPVMPGQGGDKPGRVTVVRNDGQSCGSADVEMVSLVSDLRWYLDSKPQEAHIVATATWNLDRCTVEIMGR